MSTDSNVRSGTRDVHPRSGIDAYFQISERGSTVEREIRGGFATFFTMAYIVVLNPLIIGAAQDANGQRLDLGQLTTSTALVACVMTVLMGVVGRYPRSEEHTSELQSHHDIVCRLLLEKKK